MRILIGGCIFAVAISTFAEDVSTNALPILREQQSQEDSAIAQFTTEKQAEITRLEAEIAVLLPEVDKAIPADSSLLQITEIGRQRTLAAESIKKLRSQISTLQDAVTKTQRRANISKYFRSHEIAAEDGDPAALRKREFDQAYAQYKEVCGMVDKGHLDASHQKSAWNALCDQFKVEAAKDKPGSLVWNPSEGAGQSAPDIDWVSPATGMQFVWVDNIQMWVGKFEVTNAEYRKKVPEHDSGEYKGHSLNLDRQPVVMVNAQDSLEFAEWLTDCDLYKLPAGFHYRLPTPEEWTAMNELHDNNQRPAGNYRDASWLKMMINAGDATGEDLANSDYLVQFDDGYAVSAPVEESGVNAFGLYGVGGNVWEICFPRMPNAENGSWADHSSGWWPINKSPIRELNTGFRLVVAVAPKLTLPIIPVATGNNDRQSTYAERRRQRIEDMRKRAQESRNLSEEEVEKRLREYQMKLIREGKTPLPIPLTEEMKAQLVKEGTPLPLTKEQGAPLVEEGLLPPQE